MTMYYLTIEATCEADSEEDAIEQAINALDQSGIFGGFSIGATADDEEYPFDLDT